MSVILLKFYVCMYVSSNQWIFYSDRFAYGPADATATHYLLPLTISCSNESSLIVYTAVRN